MRPDLLEELCFVEALEATLPESENEHAAWTRTIGFPANEFPHEWVQRNHPPSIPRRAIFSSVILQGDQQRRFVVTDPVKRSVQLPLDGLHSALYLRALEYAEAQGLSREQALSHFQIGALETPHPGPYWLQSNWGLGYQPGLGLCTVLDLRERSTEDRFLWEQGDYKRATFNPTNL